MMSLQTPSVSDLNAQAIGLLSVGNYGNAIVKLQEALELMRSALQESDSHSKGQAPLARGGGGGVDHQYRPICVPVGTRAYLAMCERTVTEEEEGTRDRFAGSVFRFFDRAFALSVANVANCENRTSCVILYNLALGHSLSWFQTRENADLSMAIKLYKMALAIVESCTAEDSRVAARDDYVLLQLLAIFNNLGYLHYYQAKEERRLSSYQEQQETIEQRRDGLTPHCVEAIRALISTRYPPSTGNGKQHDASREASDIVIVAAAAAQQQQQQQRDHHPSQDDFLFFRWSVLFLFQRLAMKIAPAA